MWEEQIKTYQEAVEYLFDIPKFTKKNSLQESKTFYESLNCPGKNAKIIHVAGTNGKGSVCSYLNQILLESGHLVGMFTSPHLISIRERFQVSGNLISQEEFLEVFIYVKNRVQPPYHPTYFELLFFMAMVFFEKQKVEYIILETGLGGRLDATNVIESPAVVVLTEIGFDHMQYLGNSIAKIAYEKAGIIKENVPVVYVNRKGEAADVIRAQIKEKNAIPYPILEETFKKYKMKNKMIDFSLKSRYYDYVRLTLSTQAVYQVENVSLAVAAIEAMDKGKHITKEQIQHAVLHTRWEGRMEEIFPDVFVDGAHNEDGIKAFLKTVQATEKVNNILMFSAVRDKEYEIMIRLLAESEMFAAIIVTSIEGERGISAVQLKEIFQKYTNKPILLCEDAKEALGVSMQEKAKENTLYIVGSLYLVGAIKEMIS